LIFKENSLARARRKKENRKEGKLQDVLQIQFVFVFVTLIVMEEVDNIIIHTLRQIGW
jgi:hypothetical protein